MELEDMKELFIKESTFENFPLIPQHTREALLRYLNLGIPTGDFLKAVLTNKLYEAFEKADRENLTALPYIVKWLNINVPTICFGSEERFKEWTR